MVDIAGYRIAWPGGIFFKGQVWMPPNTAKFASQKDYAGQGGKGNLWRGGITRKHRSTAFTEDYASLLNQKVDILVTHEAPCCHPHGFPAYGVGIRNIRMLDSGSIANKRVGLIVQK